MSVKKFVVGIFTDEQVLFPAVKKVRSAGYKIHDVYTPMPIHGLDDALGLRQTSLHTAGFIYGITGTTTAVGGIGWIFNSDWPINFGGKSHFDLPAWIPITFELTVLFAAVGMTLTFCYLNQIMPGVKKHVFHPRQSDDLFVMAIEINKHTPEQGIIDFLNATGAKEVSIQVAESNWWYGRWDKKEPYESLAVG